MDLYKLGVDHVEGSVRKVMWEIRCGDVPLYVEEFRVRPGEENRRERFYVYLPYSALFIKL
jgi:hypothetical protein